MGGGGSWKGGKYLAKVFLLVPRLYQYSWGVNYKDYKTSLVHAEIFRNYVLNLETLHCKYNTRIVEYWIFVSLVSMLRMLNLLTS